MPEAADISSPFPVKNTLKAAGTNCLLSFYKWQSWTTVCDQTFGGALTGVVLQPTSSRVPPVPKSTKLALSQEPKALRSLHCLHNHPQASAAVPTAAPVLCILFNFCFSCLKKGQSRSESASVKTGCRKTY